LVGHGSPPCQKNPISTSEVRQDLDLGGTGSARETGRNWAL
jgi:hypothetical protein